MTLNEMLCFDYFKSLNLIAGASGLTQTVGSCGILDYEMDQSVSDKYSHRNFRQGQLALTSLLFAKNNPFQIRDAVKFLVSRGGSGLIIKNVFHLPIHDSVLRYADSKGFPVFLMDDSQMYFEEFILQLDKCLTIAKNAEETERELNRLLYEPMGQAEKKASSQRLFPRFYDRYAMLYVDTEQQLAADWLTKVASVLKQSAATVPSKSILRYRDGFFVFLSLDMLAEEQVVDCAEAFSAWCPHGSIGVSNLHYHAEKMGTALREALSAAQIHRLEKERHYGNSPAFLSFSQLGIYRALLPLIDSEVLQRFSGDMLEPILEFDAENRGNLLETLLEFVQCGGSVHELSELSGQHENTLRYRLDKIAVLTGLSYRKASDYEQLALAARIYLLLQA